MEIPARNVIFVGDTVVSEQVPFLHTAEIGAWLNALDELENRYNEGSIIVGGRNGIIEKSDIQAMREFLLKAQERLTDYAAISETDDRIDSLIPLLTIDSFFKIKMDQMGNMVERLSYGLHHYYRRNYMGIDEIVYGSNEPETDTEEEDTTL